MHNRLLSASALFPSGLLAKAVIIACASMWFAAAAAQDTPRGKLAGAIRSSGQACARVVEVEQVSQDSSGATIYRVRCNSGLFQVTMKDGAPAEVVSLQ